MTSPQLRARIERFPVDAPFVIARGAKHHVDVLHVALEADGLIGRGEGTAIYYLGQSAPRCLAQVRALALDGLTRATLAERLPPGAARNAVDAALWDLEARRTGRPVHALAGLPAPGPVETAFTVSLGMPDAMAQAAAAAPGHRLLKLKLGAADGEDRARVAAVRAARPDARLIVDANEAWAGRDLAAEAAALAALGVELIEQPVPAGAEALLDGLAPAIPFCADESCQTRADLDRCAGRFQAVNVKLDKTGGLSEALALVEAARAQGFAVMIGCMLSTSLGLAPAALLSGTADWADLDGPLLLRWDRPGGFRYEGGTLHPLDTPLWGGG